MDMTEIPFSIGVCAYNEGNNIEKAIRSIYEQKLDGFVLDKTIVVSSASTDDTDDIVRSLMNEYPNLELIVQEQRNGKNSAINCFLDAKKTEIVIIVNADNIMANKNTIQKMLEPFRDEKVGIVGGHPIPLNSKKTIAGFASNMIWCVHHHIAMKTPKIGELIAYRDIGTRLPEQYQSDEDLIRMNIEKAGYLPKYAPDAVVYNRGPETVADLKKQRLRVNIGQSYMIKNENFYNPTRDPKALIGVYWNVMKDLGFHPIKMSASVFIETECRLKARKMVKKGIKDENVWDPVETTKKV